LATWSESGFGKYNIYEKGMIAMPGIKVGDVVGIRCQVQPGPFSDERLVTIETVEGLTSGFVSQDELKMADDGQWYVHGVVRKVEPDVIEVWIRGSFFTTNGLASVPRRLAMAA